MESSAELIGKYMEYVSQERLLTANSLEAYKRDIDACFVFLYAAGITDWQKVQRYHLVKYIQHLKEQKRKPATIARTVVSLRSFFQYLAEQGFCTANPTAGIEAPKLSAAAPHLISIEQTAHLLSMPDLLSRHGLRDKAMLELLYATGIRVSELCDLDWKDVQLELGYIACTGSRGNVRIIPFGNEASIAVRLYKEHRNKMNEASQNIEETPVFVNHLGSRITRQGFWKILKLYAVKAGIENITPQTLRHSAAAHMLQGGADIYTVSELMGHADVAAVMKYIKPSNKRTMDIYANSHPRANALE